MTSRRRNVAWADERFGGVALADAGSLVVDLLNNAPTMDTLTVARIIGYFDIAPAITTEAEYEQMIDIAIGVASLESFTVVGASLPGPIDDTESPPRGWLYASARRCWQFKAANNEQQRASAVFQFDLRAMRKIDKGRLYIRFENNTINGVAATVDIVGRIRSLCMT